MAAIVLVTPGGPAKRSITGTGPTVGPESPGRVGLIRLAPKDARLEALPGWVWSELSDRWEQGFEALQRSSSARAMCASPRRGYRDTDGFRLGEWVSRQRANQAQGSLSSER